MRSGALRSRSGDRHRLLNLPYQWGYTLIEVLVIVMVVGAIATVAVPSFATLLDSIKVDQTVSELRSSFQDTQRQAIRKNQVCSVQVVEPTKTRWKKKQALTGNCLTSGDPVFPDDVSLATNLKPNLLVNPLPESQNLSVAEVKFGTQGSAEFSILSAVRPPMVPKDPTGKIVALIPNNTRAPRKCVAISSTLGLTRVGTYTGSINPADITDKGICTALDWKEQ